MGLREMGTDYSGLLQVSQQAVLMLSRARAQAQQQPEVLPEMQLLAVTSLASPSPLSAPPACPRRSC